MTGFMFAWLTEGGGAEVDSEALAPDAHRAVFVGIEIGGQRVVLAALVAFDRTYIEKFSGFDEGAIGAAFALDEINVNVGRSVGRKPIIQTQHKAFALPIKRGLARHDMAQVPKLAGAEQLRRAVLLALWQLVIHRFVDQNPVGPKNRPDARQKSESRSDFFTPAPTQGMEKAANRCLRGVRGGKVVHVCL